MASQAIETQGTKLGVRVVSLDISVSFDATTATAKKIERNTGSFVTDGFEVGQILTTTDEDNPGPFIITEVVALELTVTGNMTTDAVAAPFTINSFEPVREIVSYSGFDGQAAEIDVTNLDSNAKEWLMGLQDFGNFNIECNYLANDTGQSILRASKATRIKKQFLLKFSDDSLAAFEAYVLSASLAGAVDAKVDTSFNLRITGDVEFSE